MRLAAAENREKEFAFLLPEKSPIALRLFRLASEVA